MKVKNLKRLWYPSMKISTRTNDYSHQPLSVMDYIILRFSNYSWIKSPSGKPSPIVKTKRYTYYFTKRSLG